MNAEDFRAGFVAVIGRPNTGKSTLVNALVGEKISIVTSKPQTTRQNVLGIRTSVEHQIVFVDTPGMHPKSRKLINRAMNRSAAASMTGADQILLVIEADRWTQGDDHVLQRMSQSAAPTLLVINKIDLVRPRENLLPFIESCAARGEFDEIVPVAARRGENLDRLLEVISSRLPIGAMLYPPESITDRSTEFRIAEVIREKLMLALRDEIPYGIAVEVVALEERGELMLVDAAIWVDKDTHTGIVVGRGGEQLKRVGQAAREDLERQLGRRMHLETRVKAKENWSDNARVLRQLGYEVGR